jgi:hypothetical protein
MRLLWVKRAPAFIYRSTLRFIELTEFACARDGFIPSYHRRKGFASRDQQPSCPSGEVQGMLWATWRRMKKKNRDPVVAYSSKHPTLLAARMRSNIKEPLTGTAMQVQDYHPEASMKHHEWLPVVYEERWALISWRLVTTLPRHRRDDMVLSSLPRF